MLRKTKQATQTGSTVDPPLPSTPIGQGYGSFNSWNSNWLVRLSFKRLHLVSRGIKPGNLMNSVCRCENKFLFQHLLLIKKQVKVKVIFLKRMIQINNSHNRQ